MERDSKSSALEQKPMRGETVVVPRRTKRQYKKMHWMRVWESILVTLDDLGGHASWKQLITGMSQGNDHPSDKLSIVLAKQFVKKSRCLDCEIGTIYSLTRPGMKELKRIRKEFPK
ncbi:hypothetical protein LCGC14_0380500 [marine sediment metagenome]|uniref:HTH hxlR-type domain-containing protein n=1 Tax=marine sediment metagenome TaxID=412755 RepID=A0A0F9T8C8_9ZZZZ